MSYLIISDGQTYKIAHLIEAYKTHLQVELVPEKLRKKIKPEYKLYQLKTNDITNFQTQINNLTPSIDTELLWDMIEEFDQKLSITELSKLYFGDHYTEIEQTTLLFAITTQNIIFNNHVDGCFSKCSPEEQIKRQDIQNKQQSYEKLFNEYYNKLITLQNPNFNANIDPIKLLNKPDKQSIEYKALFQASKHLNISQLELCQKTNLAPDLATFFVDTFMLEIFPSGINYTKSTATSIEYPRSENLNLSVFSIDDKHTTEIDDAFSITHTDNGYLIGVHISAPALDNTLQDMVADNISTIYYPGNKITMLPEEIINKYSLWENTQAPVVSIYFTVDEEFNIKEYHSKLETVKIHKNLRIEELELLFNVDNLDIEHNYPYEPELKILYKFATRLEELRGKASVNNLSVDYNFAFDNEKIIITPRIRGNPIDKLVSELMILANCTWGRMLTNNFIPAIYRVKQPSYPVKMTLHADSHTGLNVSYYTWSTSPLRRSSDYINQHQIINLVTNTKNHYTSLNPTLLQVVEDFDTKYSKYIAFQTKMERFWSLKYLLQENITVLEGTFVYKSKVQLNSVPIDIDTNGLTTQKPKGTKIKLKIFNINLTTLSFEFKILEADIDTQTDQVSNDKQSTEIGN